MDAAPRRGLASAEEPERSWRPRRSAPDEAIHDEIELEDAAVAETDEASEDDLASTDVDSVVDPAEDTTWMQPESPASAPEPEVETGPRRGFTAADDRPAWQRFLSAFVHTRPKYSTVRGDIEGLRAIAVMWVILFHLGVPAFSGGFAGVDIFFVISGFLITGQLLTMVSRRGRLDLVDFYARRLRRLLPAASLVLVTTVLAGWWLLPRDQWKLLSHDSALAAVYVLNWGLAARSVDYLGAATHPTAVQHYWSLGVEEQFYLVWPLTIIGCLWLARRVGWGTRRAVAVGLAMVGVLSFAYSVQWTASHPEEAYFSSLTRVWELAAGSMVAVAAPLLTRRLKTWARIAAPLGVVMVLASAFVITKQTAWPGAAALLPVLGASLVILAGTITTTRVARGLGHPVMRQLGMLSYSMYLWHWPIIVIWTSRHPDPSWLEKVAMVALTVALSMATLRWVEDPVRFNWRLSGRPRLVLVGAAGLMAVTLAVSGVLHTQVPQVAQVDIIATDDTGSEGPMATPTPSGTPSSTPTVLPPRPVTGDYLGALALVHNSTVPGVPTVRDDLATAMKQTKPLVPDPAAALDDIPEVYKQDCESGKRDTDPWPKGRCQWGASDGTVDVAFVGDSKMDQWQPALDVIGRRHGWRVNGYGKSGCAFSATKQYPQCDGYNRKLLAQLLADPPDIVFTSTYAYFAGTGEGMVAYLRQLQAKGSRIVVLQDNPTPQISGSLNECVGVRRSVTACEFANNRGHGNDALELAATQLKADFITLSEWICPPGRATCPLVLGNVFIYRETSHLTRTFVLSMTPILERKFAAAGLLQGRLLPLQR